MCSHGNGVADHFSVAVRQPPMCVNLTKLDASSRCGTRCPLRTLRTTNRYFQKTSRRVAAAMKHRDRTILFAARSCGYSNLTGRHSVDVLAIEIISLRARTRFYSPGPVRIALLAGAELFFSIPARPRQINESQNLRIFQHDGTHCFRRTFCPDR
jgi:hypothetical protein